MESRRSPRRARGAHQLAVAVRATVEPGRLPDLRDRLTAMDERAPGAATIPFSAFDEVHFARLLLLEDSAEPGERPIPASLMYMSEIDAPRDAHLDRLADLGGVALDATFGLCEGYPAAPDAAARRAYLDTHSLAAQAKYVNTVGRTAVQIRQEAQLRDAIEAFLDGSDDLPADPLAVRRQIQGFVRSRPDLAWARRRARGPSVAWRVRNKLHLLSVIAALLLLFPLILLVLPVYALLLRLHEIREDAPHLRPDPEHVRLLAAREERAAHSPFSAIGYVKPGPFRRATARTVLWLLDTASRHVFTRADLSGIKTIHFARWLVLDDWRRVIFTSNYDGSLESYMNDFIDKVWYGLNASFSNGVGYPMTKFLLFQGARQEQQFKDYLRRHQIDTQVWYSAYDRLSALNIENNALIRSGLFGPLSRADAQTWLARL
jgi:hypothetical protein